jgi:hypothetical protein
MIEEVLLGNSNQKIKPIILIIDYIISLNFFRIQKY